MGGSYFILLEVSSKVGTQSYSSGKYSYYDDTNSLSKYFYLHYMHIWGTHEQNWMTKTVADIHIYKVSFIS